MGSDSYQPNEMFPRDGRLFSNGTEHMMWEEQCYGCRNYRPNATTSRDGCPIEVAVAIASFTEGRIKAKIALRGAFAEPGPNGTIVDARFGEMSDGLPGKIIPACPERRGYDEPDDRPRRGPRPPEGQMDLLDPRNAPLDDPAETPRRASPTRPTSLKARHHSGTELQERFPTFG